MTDQPTRLFVYGVNEKISEHEIKEKFEEAGEVTDVKNTMNGYAFVTFASRAEAENCIKMHNGRIGFDRPLQIKFAHVPSDASQARTPWYGKCVELKRCKWFNNGGCDQEAFFCEWGLHSCLWCWNKEKVNRHHGNTGNCPLKTKNFKDFGRLEPPPPPIEQPNGGRETRELNVTGPAGENIVFVEDVPPEPAVSLVGHGSTEGAVEGESSQGNSRPGQPRPLQPSPLQPSPLQPSPGTSEIQNRAGRRGDISVLQSSSSAVSPHTRQPSSHQQQQQQLQQQKKQHQQQLLLLQQQKEQQQQQQQQLQQQKQQQLELQRQLLLQQKQQQQQQQELERQKQRLQHQEQQIKNNRTDSFQRCESADPSTTPSPPRKQLRRHENRFRGTDSAPQPNSSTGKIKEGSSGGHGASRSLQDTGPYSSFQRVHSTSPGSSSKGSFLRWLRGSKKPEPKKSISRESSLQECSETSGSFSTSYLSDSIKSLSNSATDGPTFSIRNHYDEWEKVNQSWKKNPAPLVDRVKKSNNDGGGKPYSKETFQDPIRSAIKGCVLSSPVYRDGRYGLSPIRDNPAPFQQSRPVQDDLFVGPNPTFTQSRPVQDDLFLGPNPAGDNINWFGPTNGSHQDDMFGHLQAGDNSSWPCGSNAARDDNWLFTGDGSGAEDNFNPFQF